MIKRPVLVLGGRSDIGLAVAHRFGAAGHPIQLAARNVSAFANEKNDIELRYSVPVTLHEFDVLNMQSYQSLIDSLPTMPEIAVCVVGLLGDQRECEGDARAASLVMRTNYEGPSLIMALLANSFEARGRGTLVGISSVAGERGRAANYVYGSAKAGFTAFLSGLRNRLAGAGVHVITVLPGYVATKMTEKLNLPARLTASADDVAAAIERAVLKKRNVVYVKPIWAVIMIIIKGIPEAIFKRRNF